MFKATIARALLGVAGLGVAGGTTALAAAPAASAQSQQAARAHHARDLFTGTIKSVSDRELVVTREERSKKAEAAMDTTMSFELNAKTAIYRYGDKDHKLGNDALKVGDRVRVRYVEKDGQKVARRIVILPEVRTGKVIDKGNDNFTLQTAKGDRIKVTVTDKTRYVEGPKGHTSKGSFADLKVGDHVVVVGEPDGHDNFDAAVVRSRAVDAKAPAKQSSNQ